MSTEPDEETLKRLRRALRTIEPIQREVFMLSAAGGLTYLQIGERLGITVEAVERHLADALYNIDRRMQGAERPWWRFW